VKSERLVFGIDEEKDGPQETIEEILARLKSEKFNSLEITRVASEASKRFLGVRYVTVFRPVTTYPGPGSIGCRLNQRGSQAMGTGSESNRDRSGLGRAWNTKMKVRALSLLTQTRETTGERQDSFALDIESP